MRLAQWWKKVISVHLTRRKLTWALASLALIWIGVGFLFGPRALASSHPTAWSENTLIRHASTSIPVSQRVEEVLVFGHSISVAGTITDNLIVVNGDIHLASTARVGLIVDIGGQVHTTPGAQVHNIISVWFQSPLQNSLAVGGIGLLLLWVVRLVISALIVAVPVGLSFLLQSWLTSLGGYLKDSARKSGLAGVLTTVIVLTGALLFGITLIGLPVSVFFVIIYAISGVIGFSAVSLWVGGLVTRTYSAHRPAWLRSLIGATFIMAFANVPVVGPVLFLVVWLLGIGATSFWMIDRMRKQRSARRLKKS